MKGFQPDPTSSKVPTDLAARRAYTQLRRRILTGQLGQGDIVNEVAMAAELKVSRTPMREVFRELLSEGLLSGDGPRRQVRVRLLTSEILQEVFATRSAVEPLVARDAAKNVTGTDLDELRLLMARLADAAKGGDVDRFLDVDEEFHVTLSRIAQSTVTEDFLRRLRALSRLALATSTPSPRLLSRMRTSRSKLVIALRDSDSRAATETVPPYLDAAEEWARLT